MRATSLLSCHPSHPLGSGSSRQSKGESPDAIQRKGGDNEPQQPTERDRIDVVVNVGMFALLYGIAFVALLGCAFMQMRQGWNSKPQQRGKQRVMRSSTGLKTIHPELLDENGELIKDELLTVNFWSPSEGSFTPPGTQPSN